MDRFDLPLPELLRGGGNAGLLDGNGLCRILAKGSPRRPFVQRLWEAASGRAGRMGWEVRVVMDGVNPKSKKGDPPRRVDRL